MFSRLQCFSPAVSGTLEILDLSGSECETVRSTPSTRFSLCGKKNIQMQVVVAEPCAASTPGCGQTLRYASGEGLSPSKQQEQTEGGWEGRRKRLWFDSKAATNNCIWFFSSFVSSDSEGTNLAEAMGAVAALSRAATH